MYGIVQVTGGFVADWARASHFLKAWSFWVILLDMLTHLVLKLALSDIHVTELLAELSLYCSR